MMNLTQFKALTKLEQTLFGIPFMLSGALIGMYHIDLGEALRSGQWMAWLWVFPAFLAARIAGMSFNQLIDRSIDAENPRTKARPLPTGRITPFQAAVTAWSALLVFLLCCWKINALCFLLSWPIAFLLVIYSYTKRFHAACHFVLGIIHLFAPVMAATALSAELLLSPFLLGAAALFAISGTDIVYALQDLDFDREKGLHSLPVLLGKKGSLAVARFCHILTVTALIALGIVEEFPLFYYLAPLSVAALYAYFHRKIAAITEVEPLFFMVNASVSSIVFLLCLSSVLWRVLL